MEERNQSEIYWVKLNQKNLKGSLESRQLGKLDPFTDSEGILRVGGRVDKTIATYDTRHPVLLSRDHWTSKLIMRQAHQYGHSGVAATVAKVRRRYWIVRAHSLAKSVKTSVYSVRIAKHSVKHRRWPTYLKFVLHCTLHLFTTQRAIILALIMSRLGEIKVRNNTRAIHLEMAVDYSAMEFIQVLRRFFAVRGKPALILSDNCTQLVGAEREMIEGWQKEKLKEFAAEKGIKWQFITPTALHQNGCAEAMVKSCKRAIKEAIGDNKLTPFELYTCFLEIANLIQRPNGRVSTDPNEGTYLCPNDILLGRASSEIPQGPCRET